MKLKAGVILINNSKAVDRIFDYLVPEEYAQNIRVGSRVIVPFGQGNRTSEGYVYYINEYTGSEFKLKEIAVLYDDVVFDEKSARLIEYVRKKTVCTYAEAVRLVIPAGYGAEFEKVLCINEDADLEKYLLLPACERIIRLLQKEPLSLQQLEKRLGGDEGSAIEMLLREGVLKKSVKSSEKVSEKKVRYLKLTDKNTAADSAAELSKKAKKQADVIFYLLANEGCAPAAEVYEKTGATSQAAAALEKKGIIEAELRRVMRTPLSEADMAKAEGDFAFTEEQQRVFERISSAVDEGRFERFLLHGVTGAGKTEVFIQLIRKCLAMGKTAIMLVPEISLTPLMTKRFTKRFGDSVAILHSRLSKGERLDEWDRIKKGGAKVVLGARSAVFAPLDNIGIIIIDEEHELSYKSENSPRYHAREIAFFRGEQHGAAVLMASATPLVESYYKAEIGEYTLLEMKMRFNKNPLPEVYIADMRQELDSGNRSMFSARLADEMLYNKKNNEQIILLLNRRGFSTFVSCRGCGYVAMCPHCNISLTYHKSTNRLNCHYCGYTRGNYSLCPECGSKYIKYFGAGTQKLEEEINTRFEDMSAVRMDVDTTGAKNSHEKLLAKFESGGADILMGTQMVSKGLDFPRVTLVGVMAADSSLYIDDYRSSEKTFALIEQVTGRAGRKDLPGRAVIQTYSPENSVIEHIKRHDYVGFYREEIKMRKIMHYPPFCEIGSVLVSGKNEDEVKGCIQRMYAWLKRRTADREDIILLGPAASAIGKIKDKFRYRILIKYNGDLDDIFREAQDGFIKGGYNKTMVLSLDRNPANLV